jgi:two-component system cell cycle response regulator
MTPARILIVEDNPTNLQLMSYLLQSFGYSVEPAYDGEEALALIGRESLDLIICDIQLPKMDGFEVARRLKLDQRFHRIPLIAVTAFAMVGDRDKVLAAGFDGYISKPIMPKSFVSQVEAFLKPEMHCAAPFNSNPPANHSAARAALTGKRKGTVLVVDNAPANIQLLRALLEPTGLRVITTQSMSEALEKAQQMPPDLILSDVHMPHGSGFDLIRRIRGDPTLASIPFIFLTSSLWHESDRVEGLALGADGFLTRPIDPQSLLKELDKSLSKNVEARCG